MAIDPTLYNVDFTDLSDRDQVENALSWQLDQFKGKDVIEQVLTAFSEEVNELYVALATMGKARTISGASGVWLDGLGAIVGQAKESVPTDGPNVFFIWDDTTNMMDNSLQWVTGVPESGSYSVPTDADYQLQIVRRIFQNMNLYSSIPEIKACVLAVIGIDVKVEQLGARNIKLWVPTGTPAWMKYLLTAKSFDVATGGYNRWYFPFPASIIIDATIGEY